MKQKMIDAAYQARENHISSPLRDRTVLSAMLGAGISEAWADFDEYSRSTWPKEQEGEKEYLFLCRDGRVFVSSFYFFEHGGPEFGSTTASEMGEVTHYADPADLLPINTEE